MSVQHRGRSAVVAAVDGTEADALVVRCAADEAERRGTALVLAHVAPRASVPGTGLPGDAVLGDLGAAVLEDARAGLAAGGTTAPTSTALLAGHRVPELVDLARPEDLLVVGRGGHGRLLGLLAGSVAVGLATHARCVVRVVPPGRGGVAPGAPVVVGLQGAEGSAALLGHAADVAESARTSLVVLHAWHLPQPYADRVEGRTHASDWLEVGRRTVDEALAPLRRDRPDLGVEVHVVHDDPGVALLHASSDASLLVLARPSTRPLLGGHLGRVARQVLAGSRCPVDVVPPSR